MNAQISDDKPYRPTLVRHRVFWETLAACEDESSAVWDETIPGFLLLRTFDTWLVDSDRLSIEQLILGLNQRIEQVPASPLRTILQSASDLLAATPNGKPAMVVGPLLAYAKWLEIHGRYELALNVVIVVAHTLDLCDRSFDPHTTAIAYQWAGHLSQRLGDTATAHECYIHAVYLAYPLYPEVAFMTEIKRAMIQPSSGAEATLTSVFENARHAKAEAMAALALEQRGILRIQDGRLAAGLADFLEAYRRTYGADSNSGERLLQHIVLAADRAKLFSTANLANQLLLRTTRHKAVQAYVLVQQEQGYSGEVASAPGVDGFVSLPGDPNLMDTTAEIEAFCAVLLQTTESRLTQEEAGPKRASLPPRRNCAETAAAF